MAGNDLPIDFSNPAVRDYFHLIRLQVLTPISLLINVATTVVCALMIDPSIGGISKLFPTSISPKPSMIAIYVVALYIGQIGYCVLLVLARKDETKQAIIKGCGLSLVASNFVMALWAISWVLQWFIVSSVMLSILVLLLLYCNIVLLIYHSPTSSRPLDTALIHAPVRLFFILPYTVLLANSLFIACGLYWDHGRPQEYAKGQWIGFGVFFGVNFLGVIVVALRHDVVWCVGAAWICASVWSQRPKPAPVQTIAMVFTVLYPFVLIFAVIYGRLRNRRRGAIALPPDDPEAINDLNNRGEFGDTPSPFRRPSTFTGAGRAESGLSGVNANDDVDNDNAFGRSSQQDSAKARAVASVWG